MPSSATCKHYFCRVLLECKWCIQIYIVSCIENNCASPFPISKEQPRRKAILKTINFEVHCVCHLPYDGAKMIKCSKCSRWYHMKCLKLKETKGTWFCSNCSSVPKGEYACIFTCRSTYISILQMISPLVLMEIINKSFKKVQVGATLYNIYYTGDQLFQFKELKESFFNLEVVKNNSHMQLCHNNNFPANIERHNRWNSEK